MAQVPHLLVGRLEPAEELYHLPLEIFKRVIILVVGDLAPQVRPELLDWVESGRVGGQVEDLETFLLQFDELPHLFRVVGRSIVNDHVQVQLRVRGQERAEERDESFAI